MTSPAGAAAAGTIEIGGDLVVRRMGFGAMRITGNGIWGEPPDEGQAKATLRRVVELGVNFIDTADSYGPEVSETPDRRDPVPVSRAISSSPPRAAWCGRARAGGSPTAGPSTCARPARAACGGCGWTRSRCTSSTGPTRRCRWPSRSARSCELKDEGKIRHIGISNVSEAQLRAAQQITPVVSVQNRYNAADRGSESMVDTCEQEQIAFLPWAPIQQAESNPAVAEAAKRHGASPRQIVLAWLLARSPQMLPIPGTGSPGHAEANIAAASIELSPDEVTAITGGA